MADTSRVLLYTPQDEFIEELNPDYVFERIRTEQLNGEHSLKITTSIILAKETRVLVCDGTGTWREYVVIGEDAEHASGRRSIGTYYAVWSLQHDLQVTTVSGTGSMPGVVTPVSASVALNAVLMHTKRWVRGTVTQSTTGGASMDNKSAWEALGVLVKVWGGEVDTTITVDADGVVSRAVDLYSHLGSETALRRFDYARDLLGIRRRVAEDAMCCRIIPLGKGEETESGGYGRKIDIKSVNDGVEYLQNDDVAEIYRMPDGNGGYEYPTLFVENSDITDPEALKVWGLSVLDDWTLPKVTYEASVLQLAQAGMSVQGLALGDEVQCVDKAFGGTGLRITGRVVKLVTNELDPSDIRVTLGNLGQGLPDLFTKLDTDLARTRDVALAAQAGTLTTAEYLDHLLENLNSEINALGGYTYITDGNGMRTYDKAVTYDYETGTWYDSSAEKVVEIKGGTIRIAALPRTAQGEWNWRTVFTAGHIAAELVTALNVTAGFIGNANGDFFIDLDNHVYHMPGIVGSTQLLDDTDAPSLTKVAAARGRYWSDTANSISPGFYPCTDPPVSGIKNMQRYIISAANNVHKNLVFYSGAALDAIEYEDGETYTVSCYARVVSGTKAVIEMRCEAMGMSSGQGLAAAQYEIDNTEWKQYSWTATADSTKGLFRVYVGVFGRYIATVEICGIKCERGHNATGWTASSADLLQSMTAAAKTAVDEQTQTDIFNKLTSNGLIQGLFMEGGQLYFNGAYIKANSIDADKINTDQLMAPKVGNSDSEYAGIGSVSVGATNYTGIALKRLNSTTSEEETVLILGATDNEVYLAIGLANGGFYKIFDASQNYMFASSLPTDNGTNALSMTLDPAGIKFFNPLYSETNKRCLKMLWGGSAWTWSATPA